jgi:hypothetical protein
MASPVFARTLQITFIVLALLIGLRVALPYIVKNYVNDKLDEMPEYSGHIGDVDMHLWRGAYSIQGIEIIKTDGKVPVPFFNANRVTFSLEWKALFNGALVGEIAFFDPVMNFVQGPTRQTSQVGWISLARGDQAVPLNINRFAVHNGTIHYRDFHSKPKVDLKVDQIQALGTNLTNSSKLSKSLVANITMTGRAFESAPLETKVKLDPSKEKATFDLAARMQTVPLTKLNEFVEAYGKFSFEKGTLSVTSELAASNGKLTGYIKPLFDDIAIINLSDAKTNPLKLAWEVSWRASPESFAISQRTVLPQNSHLRNFRQTECQCSRDFGNILKNEFVRAFTTEFEGNVNRRMRRPARRTKRITRRTKCGLSGPSLPLRIGRWRRQNPWSRARSDAAGNVQQGPQSGFPRLESQPGAQPPKVEKLKGDELTALKQVAGRKSR